jgi:putative PEP-CTERM system TPR-repeat lipoprotein
MIMITLNSWSTKTVVVLSGFVLLTGGLASCGKTETSEKLVLDAKQYQQKGDTKAAIIQLKNALQKTPDDAEARYLLGKIYNQGNDPQSAEKELRKALALGMDPAKVGNELGKALVVQGKFQQVIDEIKQPSTTVNSAEIASVRGNAYLSLGKQAQSKESFELALKNKPNFPDALIGLARLSILEKNIEAATRYSEQAVTNNALDELSWLFKGDLLRAQGKSELALSAYNQVLKLNPKNTAAYINKASMEIGENKLDAAKIDIDAARKASPNNLMVSYLQALLDFSQNKPVVAWESLQQILRTAPEHMPSVLLAGAVQYSLGSMKQAEQHLKHYLRNEPKNLYARKLLASTLMKSRQTQEAIDILVPAIQNAPQDTQLLALAGELYMQAGDFTKATEYFAKASALAPKAAEIHTALGLSKLAQGENEVAVAELETAVGLDTSSPKAGAVLAMTQLRLKNFDKALAAAKVLEVEQPDNPLAHNLKGAAYLGKKDIAGARASFEKALSIQPTNYPAVVNLVQLDLQDKKPDWAKKRLEDVLAKDKKNAQVMSALAGLAMSQQQIKEATDWLERASKENPDALAPGIVLTEHYLRIGEKQKALTLAQKLQGSNPGVPDILELLAQAQFVNNDKAAALSSFQKLAVMKPDSALVQFRIASIQMAMENPSAAVDSLKKALALQPDYLDAQLAIATLEVRKGNHEQALVIARQLQKKNMKSPAGYELEGNVLIAQKKPELAAKAYEKALSISKGGSLVAKLHASLVQAGKGKDADLRLSQWLSENPDDIPTRAYRAETYLADKQNQAAIDQYLIILRQDPENIPALNNLAWLYQQEKNPHALEYAEKANQLLPNNAGIMDTLGWILIEQGNTTRGLPILQKAITLAPESAELYYHLAVGLSKSGNKAEARKVLEKLLATGKNFPKIEEARGLLKQL